MGPVIVTNVTVTEEHRKALEAAGRPIPPPVRARLLIDTGADTSVIRHEIAETAGLKLINASAPLRGIGVDSTGRTYHGRIVLGVPSKRVAGAMIGVFIDAQISSANLPPDRIDGLIGRSALRHFEMTYNGKTGKVRLKYFKPKKP